MRLAVHWLRQNGAPDAAAVPHAHSSDVTGLGLVRAGIEVTIAGWDEIGKKADQAASDAARRGLDRWCVWKPRRTAPGEPKRSYADAWCITTFGQWWADQQELADLRNRLAVLTAAIGERATS
jgi:hypothetical protein